MIFNDTDASVTCKKITEISTHGGVLDLKELNNRLGMFVTDKLLDGIKYRSLPHEPEIVSKFKALPTDRRMKFEKDNPDWRRESNVKEWTDKVSKAECHNNSEVYWLKFWATVVDKDRKDLINKKLAEFPSELTIKTFKKGIPVRVIKIDNMVREEKDESL